MKRPQVPNPRGQDAFSTIPALKQRELKPVAVLGDVSPIEYGGGVLYEGPDGYELHYFDVDEERNTVALYRFDVAADVAEDLSWVDDWEQIAETHGMEREELTHRLTSNDPRERAMVYVDVANYHGWQNFGSGLGDSIKRMDKRYGEDIDKAHAAENWRRGNPRAPKSDAPKRSKKNPAGAVISTGETAQQIARRLARGETR